MHRAECEFLTGELAVASERLTMLSSRAANTVELATVEGVAFVLDLSEQKRAEDERKRAEEELLQREVSLREVQTELAHVGRVTTMGELASWQGHPIT